ncbi:MAG: HAMP domain-containing histidine kinase [Myxococcales bacterium]|nr:HAMP domain-containing histidine kinase [Myxococcales bacterium]
MKRRLAWLRRGTWARVTVLALVSAALVWGSWRLEAIFVAERAAATAEIEARREALAEYARKSLAEALEERLRDAGRESERALSDPLVPAGDLYVRDLDGQLLPRTWRVPPDDATPARALHESLLGRRLVPAEPDSPWSERLELYYRTVGALLARDRGAVERAVREVLAHRARFVLPVRQDAPFVLALLAELERHAEPAPSLVALLLRDGLTAGTTLALEGLERALLRRRDRLSAPDFAFLAEKLVEIARRNGVPCDDFAARAAEGPAPLLPLPATLAETTLLERARWIATPTAEGGVRGVRVDVTALLSEIASHMRTLGLVGSDATVGFRHGPRAVDEEPPEGPTALRELAVGVDAPSFGLALVAAEERFDLKTALVVTVGILAFGVVGLTLLLQRRRQRFLALKSEFVASVSHELRTPLASIQLMAETLERRLDGVPAARDYPSRIVRDVEGLSRLVENILSWQRLERGFAPRLAEVRLAELVERVRPGVERAAPRRLELTTEGCDDVVLRADADLVELVLANLAKNACQYCEREPIELALWARPLPAPAHGWLLSFSDNGVGLEPGDEERVFEDFYRGKRRPPGGRGSGLGLAICRKVMEAHGGRIAVARTGPEGTTFELVFPLDSPLPAHPRRRRRAAGAPKP